MTTSAISQDTGQVGRSSSRRWWGLIVLSLAQLMIVLDITIVNIALPTIEEDLDISAADRQWVVTAYTLAFGGLLLLGGRVADYTGRKRAFLIGLVGFAAASVLGGMAANLTMLVVARAAQGVFGALLAPTALSLLSTTFRSARERAAAFAVFGAVIGSGAVVGLMLGGVLTEYLTWEWVFYVNVPIAVAAATAGVFVLDESRDRDRARFDVVGAVLATAGLVSLVYGFTEAAEEGWDDPLTLGLLLGGAGLLVIFVLVEALVSRPLLPLPVVAHRGRGGAFIAILLATLGLFGMFFFLSFYLQVIKSYTAIEAGLAFLPMVGGLLITTMLATRIMSRVPPRLLVGVGLLVAAAGMVWLTQLEVGSDYAGSVLGPLIVVGLGMGGVFPVTTNLATYDVAPGESGVASAALNAAQQVGASLGIALLNTIAASRTADYLATRQPTPQVRLAGLVEGYTLATAWGAGILAAAGVLALVVINARLDTADRGDADQEENANPNGMAATDPILDGARGAALVPARSDQGAGSEAHRFDTLAARTPRVPGSAISAGPAVWGTVSDSTGARLSGAVLTLIAAGGRQIGRAATDGTGRYRIDAPGPGSYILIASAATHRPEARPVKIGTGSVGLDLALTGSASLTGTGTSLADGSPVMHGVVSLADGQGQVVASQNSATDGSYLFTELVAGDYTLVFAADGFQPTAQTVTVPPAGQTRYDVSLVGAAKVHGNARSAHYQRPAGEVRITLLDTTGTVIATTDTDEHGNYTIDNLAAGDYTLIATGYPPIATALTVANGHNGRHDVELRHSGADAHEGHRP